MTLRLVWGVLAPLYGGVIWGVHNASSAAASESTMMASLGVFSVCSLGILTCFGGAAAARPAVVGDLFGIRSAGLLYAHQMSVVLPAAVVGPKMAAYFRESSIETGIRDLTSQVSDASFLEAFQATKGELDDLIHHKTVTIARLMELAPADPTVSLIDPTPFVYDSTMLMGASLSAAAFATNLFLKPVDPKLHNRD